MSNALIPSTGGGSGGGHTYQYTDQQKPAENPLLLLHKFLRGRYLLAIGLAVLLGPIGAVIGYMAVQLEYTSSSIIRIEPKLPKILFESEENGMIPMFDSYIQTQVSLISSRRVMEMAMNSETWQKAGGKFSLEELEDFTKSLSVVQPKSSQLIVVNFNDKDPKRAQSGSKSIVDAYRRVYVDSDVQQERERFNILDERTKTLRTQIASIDEKIKQISQVYGSDDLEGRYQFEMSNLQTIQTELEAAKLLLNSLEAVAGGENSPDVLDYSKLTVEEIALIDQHMRGLIEQRSQLEREKAGFESTLVRPESRAEYRQVVADLKTQEVDIETYAKAFRESPLLATQPSMDSERITPTAATVTQLRSKVEGLQKLFEDANKKMIDIGSINITLKSHRTELARLEDDLELTNSRTEQLTLEGSESGRISILSEAELPGSPSNAKRRMQLAILGGLAGAGLGVALVMGLGFLRSNIRDITDAQAIQPRMLGALPLLPQTLGSTSEVISAAQSVHHIRTILHAHMPPHESLCLTVTASNSGAGKTSFALSLGLSFATAGTRTLIIDGDVIGTGLTRRTGATGRRKLGHVLRTYEVITEEESRHALQVARQTGRPIGHALIELGYISENDLQDGLAMQKDVGLGLADALNGEHVENCLADIGVPGLTILPSSRRTVANSHTMSPVAFRKLLDELRPMFDIILIDSGPVPGLSDAMIMCMCADGVIMMASRGDSETDVQRALKHLNELSVPVVGLVFNRADAMDIERSKYSSSSVSSNGRENPSKLESGNADADIPWAELLEPVAGFGPLAQSVWLSTTHAASMNPTEVST